MAIRLLFSFTSVFALFFVALQPRLQSGDFMKLKYQTLIDSYNMPNQCPQQATGIDKICYRWSHSPITDKLNFLPNIPYWEAKELPPRMLFGDEPCGYLGASFFTSEKRARKLLKSFRKGLEKKHKSITDFYTHIAVGKLENNDGVATAPEDDHFVFYQSEDCKFNDFKLMEVPV